MDNKTVAENRQKLEAALRQLEDNPVFKEVQTQLTQRRQIKRQEQRSALLKSDNMGVFRAEAEIEGINQFFKVFEGQIEQVGKLTEVSPTDFKY